MSEALDRGIGQGPEQILHLEDKRASKTMLKIMLQLEQETTLGKNEVVLL